MSSTPADAGRSLFRPRLWPTLATLRGSPCCWAWVPGSCSGWPGRQDLIAHAQAQLAAPAMALPADDLAALDYRRLSRTGSYLHDAAFAFGFPAEDGQPGGRLITPLRLEDGRVILVDRGWMPRGAAAAQCARRACAPTGPATLEGIGRWRADVRTSLDDARRHAGQRRWYGWDISSIQQPLGLPIVPVELSWSGARVRRACPRPSRCRSTFPTII